MSGVLADNFPFVDVPQPSVVVGRGGDAVVRILREATVPHPTLGRTLKRRIFKSNGIENIKDKSLIVDQPYKTR